MSKPLEDYGLIGNAVSAALVARDGSIDWLCLPRFDSAACFAALLGGRDNGFWRIAPNCDYQTRRAYLPGTAVLETCFSCADGEASVLDFMPFTQDENEVDVVRIVCGRRGEVKMASELVLRFDYGRSTPWVRARDYGLSAISGADAVELHSRIPFKGRDMTSCAEFAVRAKLTVQGTTDQPVTSAEKPKISRAETAYLCDAANRYFKRQISPADVLSSYAGVRPLYDDGASEAAANTRDYVLELDVNGPPVLSVFGGKITTARHLADVCASIAACSASRRTSSRASTHVWKTWHVVGTCPRPG